MKKNSEEAALPAAQELTIGIGLGDKFSHYCMLDQAGKAIESGNLLNTEASVRKHFEGLPAAVVATEAGTRTHWWAKLLEALGTK